MLLAPVPRQVTTSKTFTIFAMFAIFANFADFNPPSNTRH